MKLLCSQKNVHFILLGNIVHDKAELFFHFHREFKQYLPLFEQFKNEKQTAVITHLETAGGQQEQEFIVASSLSSSQQIQKGSQKLQMTREIFFYF
jgi:hypothetical protein